MKAKLRAGASRVDITPDLGKIRIQLGGYGARLNAPPTGVRDPIFVRVLALECAHQMVVLVALDHLLTPSSLTEAVRRATDLRPEQLFISASHTHCAPDAMGMNARARITPPGVGSFVPEFLEFTTERIVQAIKVARSRLQSAQFSVNAEEIPNLNRNRRGLNVTDRTMTVAKIETSKGRAIAFLVVYAAHPTIYPHTMMEVSAEFPGVLQRRLEQMGGEGTVALFMNGALGDVSAVADDGRDHHERVRLYGERLANHALRLLKNAHKASPTIRTSHLPLTLPEARPHPHFFESAGREYQVPETALKELVRQLIPSTSPISLVAIGPLLLVGFPGEPTTALGLETRSIGQRADYQYVAPVSLVNDWVGYILTREEYERGGYEATVSFNGPQLGVVMMAGVKYGVASL